MHGADLFHLLVYQAGGSMASLKHEILKNVEFATIKRRGKIVLELSDKDFKSSLPWREFQKLIGSKIGTGIFYFTIKFKNNAELYNGKTNAVDLEGKIDNDPNIDLAGVMKKFQDLEDKITSLGKGDLNVDMLIQNMKQGHDNQLVFKDMQIQDIRDKYNEIKKDLDESETELADCIKANKDLEDKTGFKQYLEIGKSLVEAKLGKGTPVSLAESDPTDIPPAILQVLGVVDWSRIDPDGIESIVTYLRNYLKFFPLKGATDHGKKEN